MMNVKMTRYTNADFMDDDSVNSVQFTEGITTSATHIRYHTGTNIWRQRSFLEKSLLGLVAILTFVVLVLAVIVRLQDHRLLAAENLHLESLEKQPCVKPECIHISDGILQALDPKVNPCDDFYSFACNGWIENNPIPEGKSSWGTFMKLEQDNQLVIKRVLEQPMDSLKSKAEQKAKMYYESCVDANETVERLGDRPMRELIRKLGGWNVSESGFDVARWSFQRVVHVVLNTYNVGACFSYSVGEDDRNSSRHVLQIDQSGLTLPTRDNYLNRTEHAKVLDAYLDYMTKIGVLLGGEANSTREQMRAVIEFETKLANITTPSELRRDEESLYHNMTIAELQKRAGFIDWRLFFEDALRVVKKKITTRQTVVVYAPEYLGNLTRLINEYENTTGGRIVLNNYMVWQTVRTFAGCLSKAFRDAYKGLRKALMGSDEGDEPQWRYCVQDTNNVLGFAVGAIFVREVFHQDARAHAHDMINSVRTAFKDNFKNLDWMDDTTRRAAERKADFIRDMIGYPDFIRDPRQLDEKYVNLEIRNDAYFENTLNINSFNLKKNLEKINEPVNKTAWSMPPSAVNAYYTPTKNQMVIPAGILQRPFYDPAYPASINYGGIGVVMGHELTHGFDDQGREFDKDGNLNHWWKKETVDRFKQRTKCFVDQYNRYEINRKHVSGNRTLGENIADNGGLKAAYNAYLEFAKGKPEPSYPGLNYNHRQLFFISFAQVWCSAVTNETGTLQIEKDPHSPAKFRVIGALTNLKEFSDAFECNAGSRMNPRKKCEVW